MRKPLRITLVTVLLVGAVALAGIEYLRSHVTIRGPVLHAIAGMGGARPNLDGITLAPGFSASIYAQDLGPVRVLRPTASGDLLASVTRAGQIVLIERDRDGDGRADGVRVLLDKLHRPHGIDVADGWLYFAETDAVQRVRFDADRREISGAPQKLAALPKGGMHFTRTLRVGPDGALYVSVGSSCNVCIETTPRAALMRVDPATSSISPYATGLRNTVGFDWQPRSGSLFGVDNGRDLLGDNYPPDELNQIVAGGFYGWPFWHADNRPDPEFGQHPAAAGRTPIAPAYAFGAHVAALSINFFDPASAPPGFEHAALVGQHGSWNRSVLSGYRVSSLHWAPDGAITERDFMVGFEQAGQVHGRPVDAVPGPDGAVYVSDDYAGAIYRVTWDAARTAPGPVFMPPRSEPAGKAAPMPRVPALERLAPAERADTVLATGAALFDRNDCGVCHAAGGAGKPLVGLASRYTVDQIDALLSAPPASMPAPPLDTGQRQALASYLRAAYP